MNFRGRLLLLDSPTVMGILNLTPDSFFDGGRYSSVNAALSRAEEMLMAGASFLDLGAYSSRPGADDIPVEEELQRLLPTLKAIIKAFPEAIISIDTFRSEVAAPALELGAHMINDISGGNLDPRLPETAAAYKAPYICMHMNGTPQTMQRNLKEVPVMPKVLSFFAQRLPELVSAGINDIIVDPGFGFGKTLKQNYEMVEHLNDLAIFEKPVLVGVSHKSMIRAQYGNSRSETLKGTTEVHRQLLKNGADILRVHDVVEAVSMIREV